jgi:hypothetical protein
LTYVLRTKDTRRKEDHEPWRPSRKQKVRKRGPACRRAAASVCETWRYVCMCAAPAREVLRFILFSITLSTLPHMFSYFCSLRFLLCSVMLSTLSHIFLIFFIFSPSVPTVPLTTVLRDPADALVPRQHGFVYHFWLHPLSAPSGAPATPSLRSIDIRDQHSTGFTMGDRSPACAKVLQRQPKKPVCAYIILKSPNRNHPNEVQIHRFW